MKRLLQSSYLVAFLLIGLVSVLAAPQVEGQPPPGPVVVVYPATGKSATVLEPLDTAVVTMMARHGIPGASLAITRAGKLVFARGYGWANLATDQRIEPDTRFGVASLSKVLTALAVLKLVDQGKLSLDDHPFEVLHHIKPLSGGQADPRLYKITVRQLLNHSGGWDIHKSGDPINWTRQLQLQRGDRKPIPADYLIAFLMGMPLDFEPGTESVYSNFGYIVLGEVVAKASGQSYEKYVKDNILAPAGVRSAALHPLDARYFKNEAHRYVAGTEIELPPWRQKYADAAGGWTISAVDFVRLLACLDRSRGKPILSEKTFKEMIALPPPPLKAREDGTHVGLGWDGVIATDKGFGYFKDGCWPGMRAFTKRLPNGVNWVLLFNAAMNPDFQDARNNGDMVQEVRKLVEQLKEFPDIDLFKEFP